MKSRHLLALATGTCLGLTGLGQVAFADRGGDGDSESATACSADYEDESENEIGDSDQDNGLLGVVSLGSLGLQNTLLGSLNNLLCGSNLLNNLDINILSEGDDDDEGGDRESEVECSADHENGSENEIGDAEQEAGLLSVVGINSIGAQNTGRGILNNALCGSNIGNDADVNILSDGDDDGDGGDRESEVECSADYEDDSENSIGDADQDLGVLSVLGLNSLGLQNTLLGSLNNLGCGANILNDLDLNILGRL